MEQKPWMPGEKAATTLIDLASCALHGKVPREDVVRGINLETLYSFAQFHSMTAICCMALEQTEAFSSAPAVLQNRWLESKHKAIRKNLLLEGEWGKLVGWMEKQGIWYCPLKGSMLKELYPKPGMRQMADFDILYDAKHQLELKEYMISQGYQAISVGKSNHDVYKKPPVYNFEYHTALFGTTHSPVWQTYYAEIKQKLVPNESGTYGFHFRDEDFYLYQLTHACKHFSSGGTGLRTLMDVYVFLWWNGKTLDWAYIRQELEKLGLVSFEQNCRALAETAFSEHNQGEALPLSAEQRELLCYLSGSGTYGTMCNFVQHRLAELQRDEKPTSVGTKLRYYASRLFPSRTHMRSYHPICEKHQWAIPMFYFLRLMRALICRRQAVLWEVRTVHRASKPG
jgi:hypothetical protein